MSLSRVPARRVIVLHRENRYLHLSKDIFLIPKSLQPNDVNQSYFKLELFDLTKLIVWNIKRLWHHYKSSLITLEETASTQTRFILSSVFLYSWAFGHCTIGYYQIKSWRLVGSTTFNSKRSEYYKVWGRELLFSIIVLTWINLKCVGYQM